MMKTHDTEPARVEFTILGYEDSRARLDNTDYLGVCYLCDSCGTNLIRIFVDTIVRFYSPTVFGDGERSEIACIAYEITRVTIHELCHWAGADEDAAELGEELVDDLCLGGALAKVE